VYTGKGQQDNPIIGLFQRLLSGYLVKGHTVFMDRFDSSPAVFDFLWARKTKAVGTCMLNRKELPRQNAVSNKMKSDECVFMRRDNLLCFKWKDTRDVPCLSAAHKMTTTNVEV